jgi:light-regulated signal transduction histidine kinase (bacteriophytochrome)
MSDTTNGEPTRQPREENGHGPTAAAGAAARPGVGPGKCPDDAQALRDALAEAEATSHAIGHELRSPIGAILILSSLLAKDHADVLDEQGRELLRRLTECAQGTVTLMDRLLVLSRAGQHVLKPTTLDMKSEVESAFMEQALRPGGTLPALVLGELPEVVADRTLIRLLLGNLLANAVKCTASRAEPRIEVSGAQDADEVTYAVRDNGIGIDPRLAGRLFTLFGRVHSQAEVPGTGVGLVIVQRVVRRHGGRVWADCAPGPGATFHVALPRVSAQPDSAARLAE